MEALGAGSSLSASTLSTPTITPETPKRAEGVAPEPSSGGSGARKKKKRKAWVEEKAYDEQNDVKAYDEQNHDAAPHDGQNHVEEQPATGFPAGAPTPPLPPTPAASTPWTRLQRSDTGSSACLLDKLIADDEANEKEDKQEGSQNDNQPGDSQASQAPSGTSLGEKKKKWRQAEETSQGP